MLGYWVVRLLGSCVDLRIVPGCTECQRCQWFVPFYGAKQVLWNSKVWIAALCCDVPHSLTAFGSYTFSLRNAYNILNSTVPADIFWHGHWNEIGSFQDWCCEIVWSKSPKSQGLFFEMVWCIITFIFCGAYQPAPLVSLNRKQWCSNSIPLMSTSTMCKVS